MYVFVYGTLRKGESNHRSFLSNQTFIGDAVTLPQYAMVNLGSFPGLLKEGTDSIVGEVYDADATAVQRMDWLEGVPRMYVREPIELNLKLNQPCWAYFYNRPLPKKATPLTDWKAR